MARHTKVSALYLAMGSALKVLSMCGSIHFFVKELAPFGDGDTSGSGNSSAMDGFSLK